jgi:ribosomal protein S18 acetylase RimI-like enzyme
MSHSITVRLCQSQSELAALYDQRWLVLRMPLGMERGTEKDEYDDRSLHVIAVYQQAVDEQAVDEQTVDEQTVDEQTVDEQTVDEQAVDEQTVIGSARLRPLSESIGSIGYVAVLPDFQNQGIGSALIREIKAIAQAQQLQALRVMSRVNAIGFYSRLGFTPQGSPHDYLGIPHQFMILTLAEANRLNGVQL